MALDYNTATRTAGAAPGGGIMDIIDLKPEYLETYLCCLEDYSDEVKEGQAHKRRWYEAMKNRGLRVKLAIDDGKAVGMIHSVPIAESFAEGRDLYFVHCVWVHGHKDKGVGDQRKRGIGKALLEAAEEDARSLGAKGLAVWGVPFPFFIPAAWFKKRGYKKADRNGILVLLWKPFAAEASAPRWIRMKEKPGGQIKGKVAVDAFVHGWCPAQNMTFERAKRAAQELGEAVEFRPVETLDRSAYLRLGISDGVFINGKAVRTGPPPSYEKIRKKIAKKIKK
jgi:GNAT superfamily N-acetyltransferase